MTVITAKSGGADAETQPLKKIENSSGLLTNTDKNLTTITHSEGPINYPESSPSDLYSYTPIVSIILIILGWQVIYNNAKKLATRNETKSLIDDIVAIVEKLEGLTTEFWLQSRQSRLDVDVFLLLTQSKLQIFNSRIKIIEKRDISVSEIDLGKFLEFMTLDCENVDSQKPEKKRKQVESLLDESNKCLEHLYAEFQEKYKPSFGILKRINKMLAKKTT